MDKERNSILRHDIQGALAAISAGANVLLSEIEMSTEDRSLIRAQIDHRLDRLNILIEEVCSSLKQP